jgi:hypothetical protein
VAAGSLKIFPLPVKAVRVGCGRQGAFRLLHLLLHQVATRSLSLLGCMSRAEMPEGKIQKLDNSIADPPVVS